jgi:branched-chain amino acid transport system substrate-binding protein
MLGTVRAKPCVRKIGVRLMLSVALTAIIAALATTSSSAESAATAAHASGNSVTNFLAYVGGKAGKANPRLSSIEIGWLNQQGGTVVPGPGATPGAELAVRYVDDQLGGVGGHPLTLKTCFVQSAEEEGTTCGQQFLNTKQIAVVATGGVATGIQSMYATLAGKKFVVVGVSLTPIDSVQKNAVILFGDASKILAPIATYGSRVLHAKTAALVYPNEAGVTYGAAGISAGLKAAGVKVTSVSYDPGLTDLSGPLTAAGATTADMVVPWSDPAGCVNQAKALQQLGITDAAKIVTSPVCLTPAVAQGLGGDFPRWTYGIAASLAADPHDPAVPPYLAVLKRYGALAGAADPWTETSFADILTIVKWMNALGVRKITSSGLLAEAKAFHGPMALGAPSVMCGKYPHFPAVCNDHTQFYRYGGKGTFTRTAGWLGPPA